jgi:hypothetical protein
MSYYFILQHSLKLKLVTRKRCITPQIENKWKTKQKLSSTKNIDWETTQGSERIFIKEPGHTAGMIISL